MDKKLTTKQEELIKNEMKKIKEWSLSLFPISVANLDKIGEHLGESQHSSESEDEFRKRLFAKAEAMGQRIRDEQRESAGSFCKSCLHYEFGIIHVECEDCRWDVGKNRPGYWKNKEVSEE